MGKVLLFLTLLIVSPTAVASLCDDAAAALHVPLATLQERAGDTDLLGHLTALNDDANVPLVVKKALHDALVKQETTVAALTEDVRNALGADPNSDGKFNDSGPQIRKRESGKEVVYRLFLPADRMAAAGMGERELNAWVALHSPRGTPKEFLAHELAHARFLAFLDRNFQDLARKGRLPEWALTKYKEYILLNHDLYLYLGERYAFDVQFRVVRARALAEGKPIPHEVFGTVTGREDETMIRSRVVKHITEFYPELGDPRLRVFDTLSLSDIFRGSGRPPTTPNPSARAGSKWRIPWSRRRVRTRDRR